MIPQFKVLMDPSVNDNLAPVLASGYIGQGQKVNEFEAKLQEELDFEHAVSVNSATSALWLALHLAGVKPGDKVMSTPMTCSATNEVITLMGAHIVWADVDYFGNIDPVDVKRKINSDIKAVMAVDWGGTPCDYDELRKITKPFNIPIIEDAAHAYRATYNGGSVARTGGDYVAYSFQAIKHLTTGDGGLLVTPPEQYDRAVLLRWYGLDRTQGDAMRCRQDIAEAGFKFHMNDINATIGLSNINLARNSVELHRSNAFYYNEEFVPMGLVPRPHEDRESSYWVYTIHVPQPLAFEVYMKNKGIGVSQVHNRNDFYTCFSKYRTALPQLGDWFDTMSAIPVGWWLRPKDLKYIADNVKAWVDMYDKLNSPSF